MLPSIITLFTCLVLASEPASSPVNVKESAAYTAGMNWAKQMASKAERDPKTPCCKANIDYQKAIGNPISLAQHKVRDEKILIFVSFSMPQISLKALADSKASNNDSVTLLLRGLVDNDFKRTSLKIQDIGAEIDIDPTSFNDYEIKEVPTFILLRGGKEVARLSGNVTFDFASNKLREGA